ncbi:MAG: hypothetical protein OXS33_12610 [bacterium]|nr:hypothetical protein [bacterium]
MSHGRTPQRSVRRNALPDYGFPQVLENFKEASGMSWDEIAWRLGTTTTTLHRWRRGLSRPSYRYLLALHDLAQDLGLGHLLPAMRVADAPIHGPTDQIRAE